MSLTLQEIKERLTHKPGTSENVVLRINMLEWPADEMEKVCDEMATRISLLKSGVDTPTATDGFLLSVLEEMAK